MWPNFSMSVCLSAIMGIVTFISKTNNTAINNALFIEVRRTHLYFELVFIPQPFSSSFFQLQKDGVWMPFLPQFNILLFQLTKNSIAVWLRLWRDFVTLWQTRGNPNMWSRYYHRDYNIWYFIFDITFSVMQNASYRPKKLSITKG